MTHAPVPVIGFGADAGVRIDFDALLERKLLVQAGSGGGKSTVMRALAEQLVGRIQQFVIDTEGDLVTLREAGDFIIVGVDADVPPDVKTVKLLVRRLMELGASAIFDLSGINVAARREYVRHLFEELSHLPRALWHPLMVWLDEGHVFAPQSESAVSTSAVANAAATWRKRGYCLVVATQRLSKLDKDVAAELHNKLIGFTDDVDVKRAGDQLGMTAEQRSELQQLQPGSFYAKGPALGLTRRLVRSPVPKTAPPPKGQARTTAPPAPEKVRAILGQLADLAKASEEEQRTVEDLRRALAERDRRIRTFEKSGAERIVEKPVADPAAIQRAVQAERTNWSREISMVQSRTAVIEQRAHGVLETARALTMLTNELIARVGNIPVLARANVPASTPASTAPVPPRVRERDPAGVASVGTLPASEQKIVNAMGAFAALGMDEVERGNVAVFAGYRVGGRFNNLLGSLRAAGLVDYPRDGLLALSDAGRRAVQSAPRIESLEDLHAAWRAKLEPSQVKLFDILVAAYPNALSRERLAEATGYTVGGRFNNLVGSLRSLGIADYPTKGEVIATTLLFPEGLR